MPDDLGEAGRAEWADAVAYAAARGDGVSLGRRCAAR